MMEERFWLLDQLDETNFDQARTVMVRGGIVALVDEEAGGIVAYLLPAHAESLLSLVEAGRSTDDEHREDPNETVPCLVCQEPHRQADGCDCLAPTRYITLDFEVRAETPGDLPAPGSLLNALSGGLPKEWWEYNDGWRLAAVREGNKRPRTYNCPE